MILESVDVRVRRGYGWLKTEGPTLGFDVTRLNTDNLDVTDIWTCPLAYACGGGTFGRGMRMAGRDVDIEWAITHGFMSANRDDVGLINNVWRDVIVADRNLGHAAV